MSMVASSEIGIEYITKPTEAVRKHMDFITNVPEMSVAHRFGIALLYKYSLHKDFSLILLDNKIDNYIE